MHFGGNNMAVLDNCEPKRVFHYFEEICKIPHGSGNTKQISDYLVNFAKDHGYKNGYVMWPIRTATSGKQMTPAGATEIMEILGHDETIARIKAAIAKLEQ